MIFAHEGATWTSAGALGVAALSLKREDRAATRGGGNKVRGLEFLLAGVPAGIVFVTAGGTGSTHCLCTAVHAAALGHRTVLAQFRQPDTVESRAVAPFDPVRMAGRILGQGDVVALVEQAAARVDAEAAQRLEQKARSKHGMDLADFLVALKQMQAMGPLKQVLGLLPGVSAKALAAVPADDRRLKHVEAIVLSMTPAERADPSILNGSRRLRVAKGAGRSVQDVNRLLEQFQQMRKLLKRI